MILEQTRASPEILCSRSGHIYQQIDDLGNQGKLVPVLEHSVLHASTLTILVISSERYNAICRPLKAFLLWNKPHPLPVVTCVWGVALLTSLPFLHMTSVKNSIFYDGTPCQVCNTAMEDTWNYVYVLLIFVVFFLIPFFLLFVMYGNIIRHLRRRMQGAQGELASLGPECCTSSGGDGGGDTIRARRQVIRMLLAVIALFFLSLAPLRIIIMWLTFSPPDARAHLGIESYYNLLWVCRMLMYINSAGNPIIYSLLSSNFKKAFTLLLQGRIHSAVPTTGATGSLRRVSVSVALKRMSLPAIGVCSNNGDGSRSLMRNNRGSRDSTCFSYMPNKKYSITSA
ncbi:thyrotropin-releasing hormone receptor [Plakobranchus ocellatus]|uniref:Thyrotropin-releasing hormone receptor n=1 Tax=Plakobranchus ocellatus TaxID=259542 RepID=A0AAV4DKY5_9GAST|nr:thyrotropin-releasing hormone receptor [Plakobranchus ocellatus]